MRPLIKFVCVKELSVVEIHREFFLVYIIMSVRKVTQQCTDFRNRGTHTHDQVRSNRPGGNRFVSKVGQKLRFEHRLTNAHRLAQRANNDGWRTFLCCYR